jgi:uncharacterized phiE125 gp8 family phage protein
MTLLRTDGPVAEPVTLADARAHLRIAGEAEDGLIEGLIRAAREEVERATGLALLSQRWRLVLDRWPAGATVLMRRHPVRAVEDVTVYAADGAASVLDPADYLLDPVSRPARLQFLRPLPAPRRMNGIEIDFLAGFGEAGSDVPDGLKRAILLLVAHWYEFRAAFDAGDQPVSLPSGYERLIAGWKELRL